MMATRGFGKFRLVMAMGLAIGAFGCVNASSSHDGAQSAAAAQTTGASLGDDSAQARSESTRDVDRSVAISDSDHATRHADRGDGTGSGPNPVPWSPSAGMRSGPGERPTTSGTIRVANPYNQR